jgi:hypothetical protein
MGERAMRPFWVHQMAEYLIGAALVAQGMQDRQPLVPSLAGALVVINASIVHGPLGAFKWVRRGQHRWLDLAVMTAIVGGVAQPWLDVTAAGQVVMLVMLLPLGFLWFYTDWSERPARRQRRVDRAGHGSASMGRSAGRVAGTAYSAAKSAVRKRSGDG